LTVLQNKDAGAMVDAAKDMVATKIEDAFGEKDIFNKFDYDKTGYIDFDEFSELW
jgi:Ca2+-binding EF-hand superfamily protein